MDKETEKKINLEAARIVESLTLRGMDYHEALQIARAVAVQVEAIFKGTKK